MADAGTDQSATLMSPVTIALSGSVSDDGLPNPPAAVTTQWSLVSGPGTVSFADPTAVDTNATFSLAGIYLLRLTVSDSSLSASDDVTISVVDPSSVGSIISVDPNLRHQTMVGWEAVAQIGEAAFAGASLVPDYRNAVADLAVDAGINRVRLEVTSGAENPVDYFTPFLTGDQPSSYWRAHRYETINDNSDPNLTNLSGFQFAFLDHGIESAVLPLKARLEAQGEKLYVNLLYVDFGSSAFELRDNPAEYGEFMLVMFQHMESKYGFVPDAIEVILEPDHSSANWPKNTIGPALVAAGDRLKAAGYTPDFIGPSTSDGD